MASKRDVPCNSMNRRTVAMASRPWLARSRTRRQPLGKTRRRDLEPRKRLTPANIFAIELRYETKVQVKNTVSRPHWSNNAWTRVRRFGVRQRKC
jgi:hypothetical protein